LKILIIIILLLIIYLLIDLLNLKLRKIIIKIRASPQRRERFKQQCVAADVKSLELIPDVVTRWNSTNDMIARVLELKQVCIYIY
jgi:hypothetical protein